MEHFNPQALDGSPCTEQIQRVRGVCLEQEHDDRDEDEGVLGVEWLEQVVVDLGAESQVAEGGRDLVGGEDEDDGDEDGLGELAQVLVLEAGVDGHGVDVALVAEAHHRYDREYVRPLVGPETERGMRGC